LAFRAFAEGRNIAGGFVAAKGPGAAPLISHCIEVWDNRVQKPFRRMLHGGKVQMTCSNHKRSLIFLQKASFHIA
jgi:hypothetical protein